jgi:hypothetical protein
LLWGEVYSITKVFHLARDIVVERDLVRLQIKSFILFETLPTTTETVTITTIPSTSHKASVSFSDTDGLLPLNSYDCFIQLEVDDYLSAKSIPVHVYIVQATSNVTGIALFLFIILKMHCYKP